MRRIHDGSTLMWWQTQINEPVSHRLDLNHSRAAYCALVRSRLPMWPAQSSIAWIRTASQRLRSPTGGSNTESKFRGQGEALPVIRSAQKGVLMPSETSGSKERVAYDLMEKIHSFEKVEKRISVDGRLKQGRSVHAPSPTGSWVVDSAS